MTRFAEVCTAVESMRGAWEERRKEVKTFVVNGGYFARICEVHY